MVLCCEVKHFNVARDRAHMTRTAHHAEHPKRKIASFPCSTRISSKMFLEDGTYDAFVIDARDDEEISGAMRVELTITSGARKGEVVNVRATNVQRDVIALIGMPATLRVENGEPHLTIDD